jgi:hypothetical protein
MAMTVIIPANTCCGSIVQVMQYKNIFSVRAGCCVGQRRIISTAAAVRDAGALSL